MPTTVTQTDLPGVLIFEPDRFKDERGFFMETYNQARYVPLGLSCDFVQDNHSQSTQGVLRGLHYQLKHPQGKFIYVVRGEIFDVAVDIRKGSPTFCQWSGVRLSVENKKQLYIPEGFAHGFVVLSDWADVLYKCTEVYHPGDEYGIIWSDRQIGIDWPGAKPILSEKDSELPPMAEIPPEKLPLYEALGSRH